MAAGPAHDAAFVARLALRTRHNNESMLVFMALMMAIAAVFALLHLVRRRLSYPLLALSTCVRRVALRSVPGLPSAGHGALVGLFVAINVVLALTNLDNANMPVLPNVASRAAWLALGNMVLVVTLALKNTPLALLTPWSYERLNVLHRVAGYTTVALVAVHASCYAAYFVQSGRRDGLLHAQDVFGMVAGLCFLVVGLAAAVVRRRCYELFYYLHLVFWIVAVVAVGLHQPELRGKVMVVTLVAAGLWLLDRLVRLCRLLLYSANNSVELTPLPNGATRVTLAKPPVGAVSGKHCFLWIPRLRACETHPFTIAAVEPLEFVVASHHGFTRDLHTYAVSHPGASLKASVEGTYGTVPDAARYHTLVLVAGGSGASFTFGMALDALRRLPSSESKHIVFLWAVKHEASLCWFQHHLTTLRSDGRVSMQLFVTGQHQAETQQPTPCSVSNARPLDMEKAAMATVEPQSSGTSIGSETLPPSDAAEACAEGEGTKAARRTSMHDFQITYRRPDVAALIRSAVDATPTSQRVLVLGCGPDAMMTPVRNTAAACIRADGPSVELHCEQFGW